MFAFGSGGIGYRRIRLGERVFHLEVGPAEEGERVDVLLARKLPILSRARAQKLISEGQVSVNGVRVKSSFRPRSGDQICTELPEPVPQDVLPRNIPIDVLTENEDFLVLNKPAGLVVHPAPGHLDDTLVSALLYHVKDLSGIGGVLRPGIVHRLDKDTSGALLVAKNDLSHRALSRLFKNGEIHKTYLTIVKGRVAEPEGKIDLPVGRHPVHRKKMSVVSRSGRQARTYYKRLRRYESLPASLLEVRIETGRTHQIRVHMAALGHPVLGDVVYGGKKDVEESIRRSGGRICRQMLHAWRLEWVHPDIGGSVCVEAPLAADMEAVLALLARLDRNL